MEMPKGFKKTEVGVIPSDWDVKKIGDCLLRNPDYGINAAAVSYNENLPVYLRITDVTEDGKYSRKNLVSVDNLSSDSYYLQEGDLVFARTGASVGKTYLYNKNDGELVFAGFLIRVKANEIILLPDYLKYFTQTNIYWNWIAANSMRTGQPGINGNEYKELLVPLPPTKAEQTAIATALNDADALITQLEKLIVKKRAIKQGAMQELLKPKEGWEVKKLGDVVDKFVNGGTPSTSIEKYWQGRIPWISGADILNQKIGQLRRYITEEAVTNSSTNVIKKGNLLFVSRTGVGKLAIVPFDIAISQDFTGIYVNKSYIVTDYLYRYFDSVSKELQNLNQGTSIQGITRETLFNFPIPLPPLEEQIRIAQILSDMDEEIEALEKKFDKYKMLKQGMMQNLLTGKIRLIVNG